MCRLCYDLLVQGILYKVATRYALYQVTRSTASDVCPENFLCSQIYTKVCDEWDETSPSSILSSPLQTTLQLLRVLSVVQRLEVGSHANTCEQLPIYLAAFERRQQNGGSTTRTAKESR